MHSSTIVIDLTGHVRQPLKAPGNPSTIIQLLAQPEALQVETPGSAALAPISCHQSLIVQRPGAPVLVSEAPLPRQCLVVFGLCPGIVPFGMSDASKPVQCQGDRLQITVTAHKGERL